MSQVVQGKAPLTRTYITRYLQYHHALLGHVGYFRRFPGRCCVPQPHEVSFPDRFKHVRVDQELRLMELVLVDRMKPEHAYAARGQDKPDVGGDTPTAKEVRTSPVTRYDVHKKRRAVVNTEEETRTGEHDICQRMQAEKHFLRVPRCLRANYRYRMLVMRGSSRRHFRPRLPPTML